MSRPVGVKGIFVFLDKVFSFPASRRAATEICVLCGIRPQCNAVRSDRVRPQQLLRPLRSLFQRYCGLDEGRIADAIDRGAILVDLKAHLILELIRFLKHLFSYLGWNSARKPLAVSARRCRSAAWPELSGGEALAAANERLVCVLIDGWPVVSVHCSFGLALHTGHGTDNIRFNVS